MDMDYSITVHTALRVAALFAQLPMLSGFSVQERATLTVDRGMAPLHGDLCVADVSVDPWAVRRDRAGNARAARRTSRGLRAAARAHLRPDISLMREDPS